MPDTSPDNFNALIAPALHPHIIHESELTLMPSNPRIGNVNVIEGSLKTFGLMSALVFRNEPDPDDPKSMRKVVYAGNHRLQAARNLGWSHVAAIDGDHLTHDQIRAYSLADNKTGDMGTYDDDLLASLLGDLGDDPTGELLAATGYTNTDLDRLMADFPGEPDMLDDGSYATPCPECGK